MTSSDILHRFANLKVWQSGDLRAPHKPLLVLLALGLYSRGIRVVSFSDYEAKLSELLREFAPQRRTLYPEMPFVRLRNDNVWQLSTNAGDAPDIRNDSTKTELRKRGATGQFSDEVRNLFERDPNSLSEVARLLLSAHFPESIHGDILDAVGLALDDSAQRTGRRRDPNFRSEVLMAYQYRCALCNLDLRIANMTIGLEAAHIKWHQFEGPDVVANGVALCCMHHKLFDIGAFTLSDDRRVLVSDKAHGTQQFEEILLRHHGGQMNSPVRTEHHPARDFVAWHRAEVFKGHARPV
ncbi:hypothetical protein NOV72_04802 [Caballeronia novacaledonica]|uniref:Uncharacterized protein n=1 Tax=Caballeronia novacaledonica TaxID=1544861 RepID=A0A2U3IBK6_9BURK|nr:HNH endonuclease [Caballeronia novacaledonica]SPB17597.1 hypothetical protein NOV72_04802 [Caballeronia novacaledonica]